MLLVTGIGLLVGGLVLVDKNYDKINPQMARYNEQVKETAAQTKELKKAVQESSSTYEASLAEIDKQEYAANNLMNELESLSASYTGSSIEQEKMQAICDELNSSIDGLNLSYDKNTGAISENEQTVRGLITAKYNEARANAELERYTGLVKEQSDAEYNLYLAKKTYDDMLASGESKGSMTAKRAYKNIRDAQTALDDANEALNKHDEYIEETTSATENATEATDELNDALNDTGDKTERIVIAGRDMTDVLAKAGMTADEASGRLGTFTSAATNMFDRIDTESKWTVEQMIENLQANAAAIEEWGTNIAYLGGKLPSELLQPLIDQGPEQMAGVIKELAGASDEELAELSETFAQGGTAALQAWLESFGIDIDYTGEGKGEQPNDRPNVSAHSPSGNSQNPGEGTGEQPNDRPNVAAGAANALSSDDSLNQAVVETVKTAKDTMVDAVESADFGEVSTAIMTALTEPFEKIKQDFKDIGSDMTMNFIIGMLSRKAEIVSDAIELAEAATSAFRDHLRVSIPSTEGEGSPSNGNTANLRSINTSTEAKKNANSSDIVNLLSENTSAEDTTPESATRTVTAGLGGVAWGFGQNTVARGAAVSLAPMNLPPVSQNNGIGGDVNITVQGETESVAKLSRRVKQEFEGVILYGRA